MNADNLVLQTRDEAPVFYGGTNSTSARIFLGGNASASTWSFIEIRIVVTQSGQISGCPPMRTNQNQPIESAKAPDDNLIIDRGRGPEIAGTRITVYTIMDFLKYKYSIPDIARELRLTDEQVHAAVDYIRSHQAESDREYGLIMERVNQPNPPDVEWGCAKTPEELRQRIRARLERKGAHDHPIGQ